jgi:hypothetical protein
MTSSLLSQLAELDAAYAAAERRWWRLIYHPGFGSCRAGRRVQDTAQRQLKHAGLAYYLASVFGTSDDKSGVTFGVRCHEDF